MTKQKWIKKIFCIKEILFLFFKLVAYKNIHLFHACKNMHTNIHTHTHTRKSRNHIPQDLTAAVHLWFKTVTEYNFLCVYMYICMYRLWKTERELLDLERKRNWNANEKTVERSAVGVGGGVGWSGVGKGQWGCEIGLESSTSRLTLTAVNADFEARVWINGFHDFIIFFIFIFT